ncbi:MAG: flagellar protein FlgN [Longimicrobiales bacterium]
MITTDPEISISIPQPEPPELAVALREEAALIESLIEVLQRQRRGIAENDLTVVDETVSGSQRILLTLGEARKKRRRLVQILAAGQSETGTPGEEQLGPAARVAWRQLKDVAGRLSSTLSVNQSVLQEAIRFGEEYVRAMFGAATPERAAYTQDAGPVADGPGGVLINRRV